MRLRAAGRSVRLAVTAVLTALAVQVLPAQAAAVQPPAHPTVAIGQGKLEGRRQDGAEQFLGVPYAAPPVGPLRFREPQRAGAWEGTRQAVEQAPACVQFGPFGLSDPSDVSEDCLYLDMYRPRNTRPGSRLPVIVWIHGGAYSIGTGTQFGGSTMAALTNSVVVSINYRLGQLGYLGLDELSRDNPLASGSYGLMDQIAALKWTRENIAALGGDPRNITVSGQSAGAGSICAMLASPQAAGLFGRAILQSGPCSLLRTPDPAQAREQAERFAAAAGCAVPSQRAACLRGASGPDLVAAARLLPTAGPGHGDRLLPEQPSEAIGSGSWNRVPVLIGSTKAESRFFVGLAHPHLTAEEYTAQVTERYGPAAQQVLARYPLSAHPSPYEAMSALTTDATFACQTYATATSLARQVPTYAYEFDDPDSPTLLGAQVPGVDMSNAHSAELAYLHDFSLISKPLTAGQVRLATGMKRLWGAFARSGDPNGPGLPRWSAVRAPAYEVLTLTPSDIHRSTSFAADHQCAFWTATPAPSTPSGGRG